MTQCPHRSALPIERHANNYDVLIYTCAHPTATPGGQTTLANCSVCRQRPDALTRGHIPIEPPAPAPPAEPIGFVELWRRFRAAMLHWHAAGYPITSLADVFRRAKTCWPCEYRRVARCAHPACGCTAAKLVLATEQCPAGKWSGFDTISTIPPAVTPAAPE